MFKDRIVNYYIDKSITYGSNYLNKKAIRCVDKILFLDKNNAEALSFKGLYYAYIFEKEKSFDVSVKFLKIILMMYIVIIEKDWHAWS
ncbi:MULTISPECIES: hypothetical protein [Methanobrevibacter]|uniref:hypothetical protein n=1 Tax=Methanobrevibacter TaxID=2172 RepID=UPI00084C5485|nr:MULTISPECIES: hypothetical protein [Methanobrevibacter]OEC94298.1 hypothetical protein A9505_08880 [Methanobrevibacter sp. A27]